MAQKFGIRFRSVAHWGRLQSGLGPDTGTDRLHASEAPIVLTIRQCSRFGFVHWFLFAHDTTQAAWQKHLRAQQRRCAITVIQQHWRSLC